MCVCVCVCVCVRVYTSVGVWCDEDVCYPVAVIPGLLSEGLAGSWATGTLLCGITGQEATPGS